MKLNSRSLALILMSDRRLDAGQLHRLCDVVMTRDQVAHLFCIKCLPPWYDVATRWNDLVVLGIVVGVLFHPLTLSQAYVLGEKSGDPWLREYPTLALC